MQVLNHERCQCAESKLVGGFSFWFEMLEGDVGNRFSYERAGVWNWVRGCGRLRFVTEQCLLRSLCQASASDAVRSTPQSTVV